MTGRNGTDLVGRLGPNFAVFASLIALALTLTLFSPPAHAQIEMAITIDDLPVGGGETASINRMDVAKKLIKSLKDHGVKNVYGFVNGVNVKPRDQRIQSLQILSLWKNAGYDLGNHTFSHLSLSKVFAEDYIENIERNESVLVDSVSSIEELKVFRFPYLEEGNSKEKRQRVRSYLTERNYKIAQVTVDFNDWAWDPAYLRCLNKADKQNLAELRKTYLENAKAHLDNTVKLGKKLYGEKQKIRHVLLLHITASTVEFMDDLLDLFLKANVKFISLQEALKDHIYKEDPGYIGAGGQTFLNQLKETKGFNWPDLVEVKPPEHWLEKLCR